MLPALLLAVAVTPGPSSPYLDVDQVQRIEIRTTQGAGLGTNRIFDEVIERKDGQLRFAGEIPARLVVAALLKALAAPAVSAPDPRLFGFSDIGANFVDDASRACTGDAADLAAVSATFKALFDQASNQREWLSDYYGGKIFHTDDYPHEKVEVTFSNGTVVSAESDSQTQYMLPFTVTQGGSAHKTFDPALSTAIADLTADSNNQRLTGRKFFDEYGDWLCHRFNDKIKASVISHYTPSLHEYLESQHVQFGRDGFGLSGDVGSASGEVRFPEWPQGVTFAISASGSALNSTATAKAAIAALENARAATRRVLSLPWVASWISHADGAQLMLSRFTASPYAMDDTEAMDEFRHHSPKLYSIVAPEKARVLYGMMWDKHSKSASTWLFLPDGRTVLVFFNATESTLGPLSKSEVVNWSSFTRDEKDNNYPWRATVTVIDRNGKVVQP